MYGHQMGDQALIEVGNVLRSIEKSGHIRAYRYGGDEFVIIFNSMPADVFEQKLERIRHSVDILKVDEYPEIHMSVSIGGAYGMGKPKELFKVADSMMYQAKITKNKAAIRFLDKEADDI